ncbi:hypothetical protein [Capsulimonas corticalis]|uniref:hypothetical protein n=1 Tax=Capsulimonas corticalis TaxID=2219043 RepID=UPI00261806F7|nr:hypothetical protein [Capsulimonas corticalis]
MDDIAYPRTISRAALRAIPGLLALILAIASAIRPLTADSDFYAHAAVGRWIVEHHAIPGRTLFLWSADSPWIAHSWLSEALIYGIARLGDAGAAAGLILEILLLTAVFAIPASSSRRPHSFLAVAATALAVFAGASRFQLRPELFSNLALVILLPMAISWRRSPLTNTKSFLRRRALPVSLLFILWANLHGGVAVGLALLGLLLIGEALQSPRSWETRRIAVLFAVAAASVCVNPYGALYYRAFIPTNPGVFASIEEWRPALALPIFHPPMLLSALLVTALAFTAWVRNPDRRWSRLLWLLLGVASLLIARRNILTSSLISLTVLFEYFDFAPRLRKANAPTVGRAASPVLTLLTPVLAAALVALAIRSLTALTAPAPDTAPVGQIAYLKRSAVTGRIFNDYNNASYLEWELYGHNTLFIDGLNAYPDELLPIAAHVFAADETGLAYLDQQGVCCVVGRRRDPRYESHYPNLYHALTHDPRWALVYAGPDGPIWVRRIPAYATLWSRALR